MIIMQQGIMESKRIDIIIGDKFKTNSMHSQNNFEQKTNLLKLLKEENIILISNYRDTKKYFIKYSINIDDYKMIDIENVYQKLNLYGEDFEYSITSLMEISEIFNLELVDSYIGLYKDLIENCELNEKKLLSLNNIFESEETKITTGKFKDKKTDEISSKIILSILSMDELKINLDNITEVEFRYNLAKVLLNRVGIDSFSISKEEFHYKINNSFNSSMNEFTLNENQLKRIKTLSEIIFISENNKVDLSEIKEIFSSNNMKEFEDSFDEIGF